VVEKAKILYNLQSVSELGESIFTQADDLRSLHAMIRDAVRCHCDEGKAPSVLRLHFVRGEVIVL
jgi:hypothetical protein